MLPRLQNAINYRPIPPLSSKSLKSPWLPPLAHQSGFFPNQLLWQDFFSTDSPIIETRPDRGGKMRTRKLRMQRQVKRQQSEGEVNTGKISSKRMDMISSPLTAWKSRLASLPENLLFSRFPIDRETVFHATEWSFAFTNLKPVIPGHVLISPIRIVDRLTHLTPLELTDLFACAKSVGDALLRAHPHADSLTFTIQDGPSAGQSVKHLHIHVMPRWPSDRFNCSEEGNDAIYHAINKSDEHLSVGHGPKVDEAPAVEARTKEEMIEESNVLKVFMEGILFKD